MEDTFESMEDGEEMEEAAEEEVDRILFDITAGDKNKITAQSHIFVFVCFGVFFLGSLSLNHRSAIKSKHWKRWFCFLLSGALGKAPNKVTDALPEMEPAGATAASDEESEEDIEEMQSRLAALRS